MTDTHDRIAALLAGDFDLRPEKVTREATFMEDLGLDSLDAVELVLACEEMFDVQIADAEIQKTMTVGHLVDLIDGKRRAA